MQYPVLEVFPALQEALQVHGAAVLVAPPGSGKSTVLPLHLMDDVLAPGRRMLMLEPRRLAARSIAGRMSALLNEPVGTRAGYRVRFESRVSPSTRIEVVTDGIMTRLLQADPALDGVDLVVFDEFHERSLQADLALALCRQARALLRPDLKLLVMSATLDAAAVAAALSDAPVIEATGTMHPVALHYLNTPVERDPVGASVRLMEKALRDQPGDVLAFLPGSSEIRRATRLLEEAGVDAVVHPLFGDLALHLQQAAIEPDRQGRRKLILATSIAETSLTIEGVAAVVDSGLQRLPVFEPRTGLTRMETVRVTRDAAAQRAGRAGRLGPGVCYRLWTQAEQHQLQEQRKPEIAEADLAGLALELAQWGVHDWKELEWVTPPPAAAWYQARGLLRDLEAVDDRGITARGRRMAALPTHPRLAHMLLAADASPERLTLLPLACDLAALLEERDLFDRQAGPDVSARVDMLRRYRRGDPVPADRTLAERIERLSRAWRMEFRVQPENGPADPYAAGRLLLEAYPERLARQPEPGSGRFRLMTGNYARLSDGDALVRSVWLVAAHADAGTVKAGGAQEGRIYLAAPVHPDDLEARAREELSVVWDAARETVTAQVERRVGRLVLSAKPAHQVPEELRSAVLLAQVRQRGLAWLQWEEPVQQFVQRMQCAAAWDAASVWPDFSETALLERLEDWLAPFLTGVRSLAELRKLDARMLLETYAGREAVQRMEEMAPAALPVPSGSRITLQYGAPDRPPVMEVRLQELFGLASTPAVNRGRMPVMLHLLSPGFKPVQVTQDLRSFWNTTYFDVRKELRQRYPKHAWPDDPWTAEAVRGARRRPPAG